MLKRFAMPSDQIDTLVYIQGGVAYIRSQAFIRIIQRLPFPIRLLAVFRFIPATMRDFVYGQIAGRRYRLFGKRDECRLTAGRYKDRFL